MAAKHRCLRRDPASHNPRRHRRRRQEEHEQVAPMKMTRYPMHTLMHARRSLADARRDWLDGRIPLSMWRIVRAKLESRVAELKTTEVRQKRTEIS
jgi:hypothetical protein